jgi:U6 snRNA-associated Sm-like protein LSm8
VEEAPLGLYIIRGDNIAVIGEIDDEMDANLDYSQIKAPPLKSIAH